MQICIHRGSNQIGGSCVEMESQGQRLLLDIGLPLDAELNTLQYLPDIPGLDGSDPSLLGILVSHSHIDHFGLLPHVSPDIPVGMGAASRRILHAAAPFMRGNWQIPEKGWDYQSEQRFEIGPFCVTPYLVDHSAYDAYAILIESDGKRIFYSGDFRAHGRKKTLFDQFISNPPQNIDVLLLEGSSFGRMDRDHKFPSETEIENQLVKIFTDAQGMALVHTSAQNIDRVVSIFRACKRTGRRLIIDLYTAAILEATANPKIPQSGWQNVALFVPQAQRIQIKNNAWFDLLKRHTSNRIFVEHLREAPEKSTLLFRPIHQPDLERGDCLQGAVYIYSQWEGYWEKGAYVATKKWLEKRSIPKISLHTSGHASLVDLKRLEEAIKPRKVVPIHTFFPDQYNQYFNNVEIHSDGERWEV
jgi:ribonuclease J